MSVAIKQLSWGQEAVVSNTLCPSAQVRLYYNPRKARMTIDWSVCRINDWKKKIAVETKYGKGNLTVPATEQVFEATIKWFNSEEQGGMGACVRTKIEKE